MNRPRYDADMWFMLFGAIALFAVVSVVLRLFSDIDKALR